MSELSTVDVKRKVTDEEFEVSREGLLLRRRRCVVGETAVFFFDREVFRDGDVTEEARGGRGAFGGGGREDGEGVEFEGDGRR